jgi:ribosomal protein S18 acetylase RimI-like enzyme
MNSPITPDSVTIRHYLKPGDLGQVLWLHGDVYSKEYQYGLSFESYVAAGLHEFYSNYRADLDRVWVCEYNETMVGFMLLMHRENKAAQLRYFILKPEFRGIGLGKKMMTQFMDFLKEKNYATAYLWTTHELPAAASLYKRYGFKLTQEKESITFGKPVIEQRYDL